MGLDLSRIGHANDSGIRLFLRGMVRKKNLLLTLMLSFSILAIISIQWILYGYSLSFGPDVHGLIGNLSWLGLTRVGQSVNTDYAPTIPHIAFMAISNDVLRGKYPGLNHRRFVERRKFSSFIIFSLLWATLVMIRWPTGYGASGGGYVS